MLPYFVPDPLALVRGRRLSGIPLEPFFLDEHVELFGPGQDKKKKDNSGSISLCVFQFAIRILPEHPRLE